MLGITCALYDEALEVIKLLKKIKKSSYVYYTGEIMGTHVSLYLTKPGPILIKNKYTNNFIKWIKECQITTLLQTGYCGALANRHQPGDICNIKSITQDFVTRLTNISGNGIQPDQLRFIDIHDRLPQNIFAENQLFNQVGAHSLLTVDHPIIALDEREDLLMKYNVDLVDMESWHICKIIMNNFPYLKTDMIKIVGDIPGEDRLMKSEINMRSYFRERNFLNKIRIITKTGWPFFELYRRKHFLQKTLKSVVLNYININGENHVNKQ